MAEQNDRLSSTISKTNNDNIDFNEIEQFDTIFDMTDDNNDGLEYSTDELNRYYQSGHLNSIMDEEDNYEDDYFNDIHNITMLDVEEKVLSQKLSQLSTDNHDESQLLANKKRRRQSNTSSPSISIKKRKFAEHDDIDDTDIEQEKVPIYLQTTTPSFMTMSQNILKSVTSMNISHIQEIAFLIHQIASLGISKEVTTTYLQSVTGKLLELQWDLIDVDRRVWPMQVKSLLLSKQLSKTATISASDVVITPAATTMQMNKEDEQVICENMIHQRLQEMTRKIDHYQQILNEQIDHFVGFTEAMEKTIQTYVHHYGIKPLKIKRDLKIALIKYDYEAEILERKFVQEKPNDYQIQIAKRLSDTKQELEKAKRELIELKQRVFYDKPPLSYSTLEISTSTLSNYNLINEGIQQRFLNQQEKFIQYKKTDFIALRIQQAESKFYRCKHSFDVELSKMWENHRNLVKNQGMTTSLISLTEQRLNNIENRWRDIHNYRINSYLRNSYDNTNNMKPVGFSTCIIIDEQHAFTEKQLKLLNRGPSYVPCCQMYVSPSSRSIDDITKKQYAPLKHQLISLFNKHHINIALSMEIQKQITFLFKNHFEKPLPSNLQQRALYEREFIQSIRLGLNKNNLILRRTADNLNTFYIGNRQEFETKASEYLTRSDAYKLVKAKDIENDMQTDQLLQNDLKEMIESMNYLLDNLKQHKSLDDDTVQSLQVDESKIKLPELYFLPDVSKFNEVSLVPYITSKHSPTWKIAKFLNKILRPFVDDILRSTTFRDEIDFIRKLNNYANIDHRLRSTTLFCTIKIKNFYALDSHENMIEVVEYFLRDHLVTNKLGQLTVLTIKNLLHIFLYNNIFCYNEQIYKFKKGSPNTMELTETLSNIYLFAWQKKILKQTQEKNELFGRYKDQLFFTWNTSTALELEAFLQGIQEQHPNVSFQKLIGSSVHYLNAFIQNQTGQLYSRVSHDPNIQRYTLPYVVSHSKIAHSDWLRSSLIRAVCYCLSVNDFQQERIYLELTCLVNGYSLLFVETHVQHFFDHFHTPNMRYSIDQVMYNKFRQYWFDYMDMQHELSDKLQQCDNKGYLIRLNYIYEYGPRCRFNQRFLHFWFEYFQNHPVLAKDKSKIMLTTKSYCSLNALLAKQNHS